MPDCSVDKITDWWMGWYADDSTVFVAGCSPLAIEPHEVRNIVCEDCSPGISCIAELPVVAPALIMTFDVTARYCIVSMTPKLFGKLDIDIFVCIDTNADSCHSGRKCARVARR